MEGLEDPISITNPPLKDGLLDIAQEEMPSIYSQEEESDAVHDASLFYFESDHLALKGNKDYLTLMGTLVRLQALKLQTVEDIDRLLEAKSCALRSPLDFAAKLSGGQLQLPSTVPLAIPDLPPIDWTKYPCYETEGGKRPLKRTATAKQPWLSATSSSAFGGGSGRLDLVAIDPRRRSNVAPIPTATGPRPQNYNLPWTEEEQRRLEELLETFPSEEVEMERWKKIAVQLGNRTPVQVQSRVQKYFLKLHKAGLPVPGRLPPTKNLHRYYKTGSRRKVVAKQPGLASTRKSTFLASIVPTVKMDESDSEEEVNDEDEFARERVGGESVRERVVGEVGGNKREEFLESRGSPHSHTETRESLPASPGVTVDGRDGGGDYPEDCRQQLQLLSRVREEQLRQLEEGVSEQLGHTCTACQASPILGTRWQDVDCNDFCSDCVIDNAHLFTNSLRALR